MTWLYVALAIGMIVVIMALRRRGQAQVGADEPPSPREADDARRYARLLVTEIALYNERDVAEGRVHRDLYGRLQDEIDRSRDAYAHRVRPGVRADHDYFLDALIDVLADGDIDALDGFDSGNRTTPIH